MSPRAWLRTAAVLTLIHAVLHTVGGVFAAPVPGPQTIAEAAMKANTFMVFGSLRSFWMFYQGLGLTISLFLTVEAVIFWLLGDLEEVAGTRLKPVLLTFAIGYAAFALISRQHFFFAPVVTELLIAACLVMAFIRLRGSATA